MVYVSERGAQSQGIYLTEMYETWQIHTLRDSKGGWFSQVFALETWLFIKDFDVLCTAKHHNVVKINNNLNVYSATLYEIKWYLYVEDEQDMHLSDLKYTRDMRKWSK